MTILREELNEMSGTGKIMLDQGLILVPYRPRSKAPMWLAPNRPGWSGNSEDLHRRADVTDLEIWNKWVEFAPSLNIAVMSVAQVDADSPDAVALAGELGVSSEDAVWIIATRRGWRAIYRPPASVQVWNLIKAGGVDMDLLVNSPAVIPPSVHPKGHLYKWAQGHSPVDIAFADLAEPPQLLQQWWSNRCHQTERWQEQDNKPLMQPKGFLEAIRGTLQANAIKSIRENANGEALTNCPWPERHKRGDRNGSFSVNFRKQVFNCHVCQVGGSFQTLADLLGIPVDTVERRPKGRVRSISFDDPARGADSLEH
ncbi:MAG: bifunctional DNA primase/polymerase [Chloroflexi bacterium]|nr:bifunctional DNA primase/polymerase [Chloroflexota bacterium]